MISVENISFSYKTEQILDGVSLTLEKGELCSVIGVNGSGKTTLIRLMGGMLSPSKGVITLDGKDTRAYSQKEYAQKISRLPQSRDIPSVLSADLIASGRYPYLGFSGRLSENDVAAVNRAIELTDTAGLLNRPLRELSGGERQRVYFAMLLAQDTPYVLLDEPATHLDTPGRLELYRLIRMLKDSGKGVLSVSHDIAFALKYSDKLLVLENRSAAFYGDSKEDSAIHTIERVLGVKSIKCTADGETEYFFKER